VALSFWLIIKADDPRVQITVDRAPLQAWWLLQPFGGWQLDGEKMSLWESEPSVGLINAGGNSNYMFYIQPDSQWKSSNLSNFHWVETNHQLL